MAKMNSGNWGAFINAVPQGMSEEQKLEEQNLHNRYYKDALVDPASRANNYYTQQSQQDSLNAGQQPWQSQGRLFDPVRNKLADVYQSARAKLSSFLPGQGQHAMGPAAQATVPQGANAAMSTPQPGTSGPAAPGLPGASGPMPLPQGDGQVGQPRPFADGGIPGRKSTGLVRQRKAKPGNKAPMSKAAQAATHPPMEKPPVDNQEMGAEGGPPRNTDAQPGSQDPMLADGGHFIQGAIKHPGALHRDLGVPQGEKIPKAKIKAAEQGGGKTAARARLADTMSKFSNGGAVDKPQPFKPAAPEKPQPNAVEKEVNNDGQRNRLGKTIKRFADGGDTDQPASGLEPAQKFKGIIPAFKEGMEGMRMAAEPIMSRVRSARDAVNSGFETLMTGDPHGLSGQPQGAAQPTPAASAPQGPVPQQGPPAPYDDNPGMIEHGAAPPAGGKMVTTAPDGSPITPYNTAGILAGGGGDGGGGAIPPREGAAPEQQGPPSPAVPPPVDFSKIQMDHQDIPNTSTQEWDKMKQGIIHELVQTGKAGIAQASMMADDQVSKFQHQNFMQYMQQGIALDAAGNKPGAMAALKTAYNYMPTGHGMHFGLDPKGNIVGIGYDEDNQKPVGAPVQLDQANLNRLLATYSDPQKFQAENIAMMEQKRKNLETTQGQVPYMRAHAGLAGAQQGYYQGRNEELLEAAHIRADARNAAGHMPPDVSLKVNNALRTSGIMDPNDLFAGTGAAAQLMQHGHNQADATAIAGMMYAPGVDAGRRAQFAQKYGIQIPETPAGPASDMYMMGGIPPR